MHRIHKTTEYRLLYTKYIYLTFIDICIIDDIYDRPYLVNNQTQFVAWAYGPRATEEGLRDLAFFHTEWPRNGGT